MKTGICDRCEEPFDPCVGDHRINDEILCTECYRDAKDSIRAQEEWDREMGL